MDVPEKTFVEKGLLHCGFIEKTWFQRRLSRQKEICLYKALCIEKFILGKVYELIPKMQAAQTDDRFGKDRCP